MLLLIGLFSVSLIRCMFIIQQLCIPLNSSVQKKLEEVAQNNNIERGVLWLARII